MRQRTAARDTGGFVFIEVLVVVGIMGILTLLVVPRLVMPDPLSAAATAQRIAVDLRLARELAITTRVNYALEFSPSSAPYTSYVVRNESTQAVEPDFPKQLPGEVTASGTRKFTFLPSGCQEDDGLDDGEAGSCVGTNGTVTIAAGSASAQVQVFYYTGRVKVTGP